MAKLLEPQKDVSLAQPILFGRDQLVNTATISRQFSKVKLLAKVKPLFITDNGNVDSVLLSYDAYEEMYNRIQSLEQEVLDYRAQEANNEPQSSVDWRTVQRSSEE
ncbi:hypothetical protein [Paenibacillus kyungheensis]